jgi:hypothetical protein
LIKGSKKTLTKAKRSKTVKESDCPKSDPYLTQWTFTEKKSGTKNYQWTSPGHRSIKFKVKAEANVSMPNGASATPAPSVAATKTPTPRASNTPVPTYTPPPVRYPYSNRIGSLTTGISTAKDRALAQSLSSGNLSCAVNVQGLRSGSYYESLQESYQSGQISESSAIYELEAAWSTIRRCGGVFSW